MKRIVSLVLALSMVLSMFTSAFAATTLPDVEGTDYESAVSALVELGIVNGYEDGEYKAAKTVTRAEMAKFLVVSAGLEPAADVNKGATNFADVSANHWATGYINVASQYGYINGYPDGTFSPDATVSYAEAVTMAIRVLGYKSVVEAKGTWPTNYIAKAQELKVLEDVKYNKYTDGATRGNVALLVWNMLTTNMWDVDSENESNGLNYTKKGTMISKYFEDYVYNDEDQDIYVTGIDVESGVVTIELSQLDEDTLVVIDDYELAEGIDFLNLLGRNVSTLYNKEEEKMLMVIPSNDDKVKEGYDYDLTDDGYSVSGDALTITWGVEDADKANYIVGVVEAKKVMNAATSYDTSATIVVKETKEAKNNNVKVTPIDGASLTIDEDAIVLIDGEWANASDIEANDVLTTLVAGELYAVSRETVEGKFEAVTVEEDLDDSIYFIKVDGENYENMVDFVVEVDEDGEDLSYVEADHALANIIADDESKFYGEDCTLFLNFLGEVVRIEFAEVEDKEEVGNFYVATNCPKISWEVTDKNGTKTYIELNEESYEVKANVSGDSIDSIESGDVLLVKFDSKDRVKEIIRVDNGVVTEDYTFVIITSGDTNEKDILDDNNYISGDYKVTSATTVVTITPVEDEEEEDVVDHYTVETSKGAAALKGVEAALVAIDNEDSFNKAAYVFVWEEAKNTEKTFGLVEKYTKSNGKVYLTIDEVKYEVDEDQAASADTLVGKLVAFVENDGVIKINKAYGVEEIPSGEVVVEVEDRVIITSGDNTYDLDVLEETYEDYKVILATVTEDIDAEEYEFTDYEEISYADIKVKKDDVIAVTKLTDDVDVILIIRGYEAE